MASLTQVDGLVETIADACKHAKETMRFLFPFRVVVVSANGCIVSTLVERDSKKAKPECDYYVGESLQLPISILVFDAAGERALRVLVSSNGVVSYRPN